MGTGPEPGLIPPGQTGLVQRTVIMLEVVNGLMYILFDLACQWRADPKDLHRKPRSTMTFDLWTTMTATLEATPDALLCEHGGRETLAQRESHPKTAASIDRTRA